MKNILHPTLTRESWVVASHGCVRPGYVLMRRAWHFNTPPSSARAASRCSNENHIVAFLKSQQKNWRLQVLLRFTARIFSSSMLYITNSHSVWNSWVMIHFFKTTLKMMFQYVTDSEKIGHTHFLSHHLGPMAVRCLTGGVKFSLTGFVLLQNIHLLFIFQR